MKFAAIDIGSNGARLLISRVLLENSEKTNYLDKISFKDVEYNRFALRLGKDVFANKKITAKKQEQLIKLMKAFSLLMELHEVDDYMALATSAFREAENGKEMVALVKKKTDIAIEVINGTREAEILHYVILRLLEKDKNYLHIDVGGGSTELNFYVQREKVAARSFPMGSIRNIENQKTIETLKAMERWITEKRKLFSIHQQPIAIGTGGNINKVYGLIKPENNIIQADQIKTLQYDLNKLSFKEKVNVLKLNPDRADTIVPASGIYLSAMEWTGAEQMIVPKVGLKDGMMEVMLLRNRKKKGIKQSIS